MTVPFSNLTGSKVAPIALGQIVIIHETAMLEVQDRSDLKMALDVAEQHLATHICHIAN